MGLPLRRIGMLALTQFLGIVPYVTILFTVVYTIRMMISRRFKASFYKMMAPLICTSIN